ncbi:MAG: cob(I)yrinic acid a,c-diamide adenosyltransferase [Candidatus Pacearchaeota archaeon]
MSIYLYTGEGAGKTTNALGLALRSLGHKHKVIMIQYLKGRKDIGEYKFQKYLKNPDNYKVYQFGHSSFIDLKNPNKKDIELAKKGLEFILKVVKQKPHLLILDEINLAAAFGLINVDEVVRTLRKIPKSTDVVMTGRYAPRKFIDFADYVNEISIVKMPKKFENKRGIQY